MNPTQAQLTISPYMNQPATTHDEELVLAARAGSNAAFGELQKIYSHRLYNRILSITRNREDAEDALQDAFFRAYRALSSFEGRSKFSSWLTQIAINSALMVLRKRRIRPEMSFEQQSGAEDDGFSFDIRDDAPSPEQLYDQHQRCDAALRAIQKLDPTLRNAMRIRISRDDSVQDIAQRLGVSSAAVKARLHRARKRLAQFSAFRDYSTKVKQSNRRALIDHQNSHDSHA